MTAAPPLPRSRATAPAPRVTTDDRATTQRVQVSHRIVLETNANGRRCWYAVRDIVGILGLVHSDRSRECTGPLDASQRCATDMVRVAGGLAIALAPMDTARDLERQARVAREDAEKTIAQSQQKTRVAEGHEDRAKAARANASTLRSAVEAARLRLVGGTEVEAATLTPAQLVRAESLRTRESAEQDAATLSRLAAEARAEAARYVVDAAKLREAAERFDMRAVEERKRAAAQADAWAMQQKGKAWA